jgi:mxaJ protein
MLLMSIGASAAPRVLRVCSDPNNLPFSNQAREGFENRIAEILARDVQAELEYTWWSERKSFIKNSLDEHRCDVLIGIPTALSSVLTTKPYYRSTYVFVSRRDRHLDVTSLTDPRLADWRIGIHVVGDDYAPPATALARRGLSANLTGFSLFGTYGEPNPPAKLIRAVARGEIDVAIAWGPLAGYFAKREPQSLDVVAVSPAMFMAVPFTYDISVGVRKDDERLKAEMERALNRECDAIRRLLADYGVPQIQEEKPPCDGSRVSHSALLH